MSSPAVSAHWPIHHPGVQWNDIRWHMAGNRWYMAGTFWHIAGIRWHFLLFAGITFWLQTEYQANTRRAYKANEWIQSNTKTPYNLIRWFAESRSAILVIFAAVFTQIFWVILKKGLKCAWRTCQTFSWKWSLSKGFLKVFWKVFESLANFPNFQANESGPAFHSLPVRSAASREHFRDSVRRSVAGELLL